MKSEAEVLEMIEKFTKLREIHDKGMKRNPLYYVIRGALEALRWAVDNDY